jgi:hypothetical protein
MKVQSGKEAWSHHFRPGRSLGTSTDKGKKTGGFGGERRNGRDPASAHPKGRSPGKPPSTDVTERTGQIGERGSGTGRQAERTGRQAADKGLGTRQWGKGKGERETERETRQRNREKGRETPAERPFQGPLGWKVAQRRWKQPERSGTRAGSTRAQQEREGQGEGWARTTPGRCKKGKEVEQGETERRR